MNFNGYKGKILAGVLALGLGYGCGTLTMGFSDVETLKSQARSANIDKKREGLKGLCKLVVEDNIGGGQRDNVVKFVYGEFDKNASRVTVYPVGRLVDLKTGKERTIGHRYPVEVSWEKTKEVFADDQKPVLEACSKMDKRHAKTNSKNYDFHKALIYRHQFEKLVGRQDVVKGKTWQSYLTGSKYKAAESGYSIHMGVR